MGIRLPCKGNSAARELPENHKNIRLDQSRKFAEYEQLDQAGRRIHVKAAMDLWILRASRGVYLRKP